LDLRKAEADKNQECWDENLHQETFPVSARDMQTFDEQSQELGEEGS
jgi:hypothetical protein